eukprot:TRINITY_DN115_c0_g1_i2.p1 TRINITY_DN115_c0_g1~~TRINITY_DN115_c0_g1_i2.p1  ORF type:complete len:531 (-),score=209.30 TRINITY_DN115_c0_g1_i2:47-1639(-)
MTIKTKFPVIAIGSKQTPIFSSMDYIRKVMNKNQTKKSPHIQIGDYIIYQKINGSAEVLETEDQALPVRCLGKGSYGMVVFGEHKDTKKPTAMKVLAKQKNSKYIQNEIATMRVLSHPNVVNLLNLYEDKLNYYLALDYVNDGSFFGRVRDKQVEGAKFSLQEARDYFRQICLGLAHCHDNEVSHRDIKLENVLVNSDDTLKLCDFGFARVGVSAMHHFSGTKKYMAPEIFDAREYRTDYDPYKTDVWAAAVFLYVMLAMEYPFQPDLRRSPKFNYLVNNGEYEFPASFEKDYKGISDFINYMWNVDPEARPTIFEVLEHPWLDMEGYFEEQGYEFDEGEVMRGMAAKGMDVQVSEIDFDNIENITVTADELPVVDFDDDEGAYRGSNAVTDALELLPSYHPNSWNHSSFVTQQEPEDVLQQVAAVLDTVAKEYESQNLGQITYEINEPGFFIDCKWIIDDEYDDNEDIGDENIEFTVNLYAGDSKDSRIVEFIRTHGDIFEYHSMYDKVFKSMEEQGFVSGQAGADAEE